MSRPTVVPFPSRPKFAPAKPSARTEADRHLDSALAAMMDLQRARRILSADSPGNSAVIANHALIVRLALQAAEAELAPAAPLELA